MSKISIVTAYYNRKKALWRTLKTMEKSSFKDFELIIVDDASDSSQRIDDFAEEFDFIRLVRIEPEDKHHMNPCIPFNLGFSLVTGDIVIIQAPECLHMGDILSFVNDNSKNNQYLVFSCYSLGETTSNRLDNVDFNLPIEDLELTISNSIGTFNPNSCLKGRYDSWFVHPIYRLIHLNFLTSIMTKDLLGLGGFDERFANGYAFEDAEFITRINKKKMDVKLIEVPFCVHDFHSSVEQGITDIHSKQLKNKTLYEKCIRSTNYKIENSFLNR